MADLAAAACAWSASAWARASSASQATINPVLRTSAQQRLIGERSFAANPTPFTGGKSTTETSSDCERLCARHHVSGMDHDAQGVVGGERKTSVRTVKRSEGRKGPSSTLAGPAPRPPGRGPGAGGDRRGRQTIGQLVRFAQPVGDRRLYFVTVADVNDVRVFGFRRARHPPHLRSPQRTPEEDA